MSKCYDEGWQGRLLRYLAAQVETFAERLGYTNHRFDVRYRVLDPLADWLVFQAIRHGLRRSRG